MDLADLDAVETARLIRDRKLHPREVLEAAIARAEQAAPLGAIVAESFDRARASVANARGPFAGVPTFIKDLAHVAGVPTTWGSRCAPRFVPATSEPFVRRFEATGVVCLGKSATPELGLTGTTEPLERDPCRNPWDPTRSAGGSSGGAACLVAAGVVPIAHASDGGGSIRIPAACCGLVGLKPSRGLVDMQGSNLLPVNIAVHGVLTRTVRDTIAFYDALQLAGSSRRRDPRRLRIGVFVDAPTGTPIGREVRDAVLGAGRLCASLGHDVEEIAPPFPGHIVDDFLAYWGYVAWIQIKTARIMMHRGFDHRRLEPWSTGIAATFVRAPRAAAGAIRRLRGFAQTYAKVMESYDVLVNPISAEPAPLLGHISPDVPFDVAFERIRSWLPVTGFWNTVGAPAIALPLARTDSGLPIGVQLGAARGNDRLLLDLARTLEEAQPWPRIAPREKWQRFTRGST
jgi:amidase